MPKGGVRFQSRIHYYAQSLIEVAVPYEKGQPAIFFPAQIVFVEELPEQRFFHYGVQYLKATKPREYFSRSSLRPATNNCGPSATTLLNPFSPIPI